MFNFMTPTFVYEVEDAKHFWEKGWISEPITRGLVCAIQRDKEGEVSLIDTQGNVYTEQLKGILFENAERLQNTTLVGTLVLSDAKNVYPEFMLKELLKFDKAGLTELLEKTNTRLTFRATDVTTFVGNSYKDKSYEARKFAVEDVLIAIDNTFEMKYKDNYQLVKPVKYTEGNYENELTFGNVGISFRKANKPYEEGVVSEERVHFLIDKGTIND